MKKVINCFLSCVLLLQTLVYSQTMHPTKQQVENIYNKVYDRANSIPVLKEFKDDNKITTLLALEAITTGIKINTKEDMAYWLQRFEIPITADAPIIDIYDKVYSQLKIDRFANNLLTESVDNTYYEAAQLLNNINMEDPAVIENCVEYLEIIKELNIAEEAQKIGIEHASKYIAQDLEIAGNLFAKSCARINVNPVTVINAYANYSQLPELIQSVSYEEKLLTDFTRQLSVLEGRYIALSELMATDGDESAVDAIIKRYKRDYKATRKEYLKQLENLNKYWKTIENTDNSFTMKMFKQRQDFVEDLNLKYLRNEGRLISTDELYTGKITPAFTKEGVFALSVLALFEIAQHFIKAKDIESYSSTMDYNNLALKDALEENHKHLYAFLEQLPDRERNAAFEYIAEDYFDNFQNQTDNLLYALAVLEGPSLNNVSGNLQKTQQTASDKFDKIYPNIEKTFKQNVFN